MSVEIRAEAFDPDEKFMRIALGLAELGRGFTAPNPMVGAVIVKNGRIIGAGYHKRAGEPHAEIRAMEDAGWNVEGATMYVTLEPCVHHGRTPPCVDKIIEMGIKRVVIATLDPNPKVHGKGVKKLQEAGIEVRVGVLEKEAKALNEAFFKYMETGLPFVILKLAVTIDGYLADIDGDSRWISSERSRGLVHKLRGEVDGIVVGVNTIIKDDPELTPRHIYPARIPARVILDSKLRTPVASKVLNMPPKTIIVTSENHDPQKKKILEDRGAEIWIVGDEKVDLRLFLEKAGKEGFQSILIEGGAEVASAFIKDGLFDKIYLFYAPKLLGGGRPFFKLMTPLRIGTPIELEIEDVMRYGSDILVIMKKKLGSQK